MVTRRSYPRKKRATRQRSGNTAFGGEPARRGGLWVAVVLGVLVIVNLYVFVWDKKTSVGAVRQIANAKSAEIPGQPLAPAPSAPRPGAVAVTAPVAPVAPVAVPHAAASGAPAKLDGKVGKGDSLGRVLKHAGLTGAETDEVIRALSGVLDFRTIRAGESFRIERAADGRVKLFELSLSKGDHVRAERNASGALIGVPHGT